MFSHLSASLQGLHTIRAFGVQSKFIEEFDNHQDLHTEAWFLFLATSRWLAIRLDWLCAMFVTAVSFCSVLAADSKWTSLEQLIMNILNFNLLGGIKRILNCRMNCSPQYWCHMVTT